MPDTARAPAPPKAASHPPGCLLRLLLKALGWLLAGALAVTASALLVLGIGLAVAYPNLPETVGLTDYRP